ncbi:MAG: hypothetical protein QF473_36660, partial [Planctomycetota bacterium]|nr:hypothetical protein [Planctomycetota bacterium]
LVNEAYLESVISKDGIIMTEARYLVQTNQLQLLPLTLPGNSEVRSLFVNGQAERPRKGESGELLVPVAKVTPGQSFMVSIVYESREDGGEMGWLGQLNTSAPGFPEEIPVLRLVWEVHAPQDYEYLWLGGNMQTSEVSRGGWRRLENLLERFTPRLAKRVRAARNRTVPRTALRNRQTGAAGAIAVNFPREGIKHQFTRLTGDGHVSLTYLTTNLDKAMRVLFFLGTILFGIYRAPNISKIRKVLGLAAGAIILASLFPSGIADWLDWVFWGAVALAVFWGAPPAWAHQKESWRKRKEKKKKREMAEADEATHDDAGAEAEVAPSEKKEPVEPSGEEAPTTDKADTSESDEEAEGGKKDG